MSNLREKHKIRHWLEKYSDLTDTLIETGSHEGNGIEAAFAYGFKQVISVEIQGRYYIECANKFANEISLGKLILLLGDSVEHLPMMMNIASRRCTFWLDAHVEWKAGSVAPIPVGGPIKCPILQELKAIKGHHIKDHIILIDDVHSFGTKDFDNITIEQVKREISDINFNYQFYLEDAGTIGSVLVARTE